MNTEYLDDEQIIALYNKVRIGRRTWPEGIWSSPAALQYAVTIFDYWIHSVMGWKGWPDARGEVTPALLEEHRLADIVEGVLIPEFGEDWLDFEIVLNEAMRLSEDDQWEPEMLDHQERVETAFESAFEQILGEPTNNSRLLKVYHRFRNHLLRMWGAFQEAQAAHEEAERESAARFWQDLQLIRIARGTDAESWSIVSAEEGDRVGEISMIWGDPARCLVVLEEKLSGDEGGWEQVIWRLEQEIFTDDPGDVVYAIWQKGFVGEFYRCPDCGDLHSQFEEDPGEELEVDISEDE
ncbi:MAG: hypothetical protein ACREN8_00215 [Candidatus Dormibacteraceae bacterium]